MRFEIAPSLNEGVLSITRLLYCIIHPCKNVKLWIKVQLNCINGQKLSPRWLTFISPFAKVNDSCMRKKWF